MDPPPDRRLFGMALASAVLGLAVYDNAQAIAGLVVDGPVGSPDPGILFWAPLAVFTVLMFLDGYVDARRG